MTTSTSQDASKRLGTWAGRFDLGWGCIAYSLFYFFFDFQFSVLHTDDFAYVSSFLETLARGRIYTYEYLAPFSATMSATCAFIYTMTGNFYLSTFGLLAISSIATFVLLRYLLARTLPSSQATWLALIFSTTPLLQVKAADFHGSILNLALFMAALILFDSGRLAWFFGIVFLAFANRQSHIVLLILPLWQFVRHFRAGSIEWKIVIYSLLFGVGAILLYLFMNKTYAQTHAIYIYTTWGSRIESTLEAALAGCFVAIGAMSLFGTIFTSPFKTFSNNLRRWQLPLLFSMVLLVLTVFFWRVDLIKNDTPFFGYLDWSTFNQTLPWLLLILLWFMDYRLLVPSPYFALSAGFIMVVSVRGIWWDYYFVEILVLSLLLVAKQRLSANRLSISVKGILGLILFFNLFYGYLMRMSADKENLSVTVYERLEREGKITPARMTSAPYGYLGWKLFDYYMLDEGRNFTGLADFIHYVSLTGVVMETQLPWRRHYRKNIPENAHLLESGFWRIGFINLPYRFVDLGKATSGSPVQTPSFLLDPSVFHERRFPLTNREWATLIDSLQTKPKGIHGN